jgi:hypothetical protein
MWGISQDFPFSTVVRGKIIETSMFFIVLPAWEGTWGLSPLLLEVQVKWFLTSHVESPVVTMVVSI